MKRQRKNISAGSIVLLLFLFSGCNKDQDTFFNSLTASDLTICSNFYTGETQGQGFGVYKGHEYFLIQAPAGEYLLQYVTQAGEFYLVFRTEKNALLHVGLIAGDDVSKAIISPGRVTDISNSQSFGVVTIFSELGATGSGEHLFEKSNDNGILLLGGVGIAYTPGESYFTLNIPLGGTYHLTYITQKGRFEIEFTVEDNTIKEIGLSDGDVIQEAYILKK